MQGRRVPITKSGFQSLWDLPNEGTFIAQCGRWHKKEKVDIQDEGPDLFGEISDAKMLHNEDERAFALKKTKVYKT